jgi:putative transposase
MNRAERVGMVDRGRADLSVRQQCSLLGLAHSGVYRKPSAPDPEELALMRWMGLEALGPKPKTSRPAAQYQIYPYLLRGVPIDRSNQVWAADITYIPMARGFLYLVAVMDWHSRYVLAWRLSNTMTPRFAWVHLKKPEIFNTDQGAQFTSVAFTEQLEAAGARISMDGRGRWLDNVFVERLWRSLKYEEVHLKAYANGLEARIGIGQWLRFYNESRPHQALGYQTPAATWAAEVSPVDLPRRLDDADTSPTTPQGQQQQTLTCI